MEENGTDIENISLAFTRSPHPDFSSEASIESYYFPINISNDENEEQPTLIYSPCPVFQTKKQVQCTDQSLNSSNEYLSCDFTSIIEKYQIDLTDNCFEKSVDVLSNNTDVNNLNNVIDTQVYQINEIIKENNKYNIRNYINDFNPDSDNESCADPLHLTNQINTLSSCLSKTDLSDVQSTNPNPEQVIEENLNISDVSMKIHLYNNSTNKIIKELDFNIIYNSNNTSVNNLNTNSSNVNEGHEPSSEEDYNFNFSRRYRSSNLPLSEYSDDDDLNQKVEALKDRQEYHDNIVTEINSPSEYSIKNSENCEDDVKKIYKRTSREIKKICCKKLSTCIYKAMKQKKFKVTFKLKKYLKKMNISLNKYKEIFNSCKVNALKMRKEELEQYLKSLILDKNCVVSFNKCETRLKVKKNKILLRRKILDIYKAHRSKKTKTVQLIPPKYHILDYAPVYKKLSSIVDE